MLLIKVLRLQSLPSSRNPYFVFRDILPSNLFSELITLNPD
jgi:hypothetical protein